MFGTLFFAFAAALGLAALLWCLYGFLLFPLQSDVTILLHASGDAEGLEQTVRACKWLRGNLCRVRLVVLDCGLSQKGRLLARRIARVQGVEFDQERASARVTEGCEEVGGISE